MTDLYELRGAYRALLGEGAYWSQRDKCCYWVDIKKNAVIRWDPVKQKQQLWNTPASVGFIIEKPGGSGFVAGLRKGIADVELDDDSDNIRVTETRPLELDIPGNRLNDGSADPFGRVWAGSMDDAEKAETGSWWVVDQQGAYSAVAGGFGVTNGPAFSVDKKSVFLTDSPKRVIYKAPLESGNSTKIHLTEWAKFPPDFGYPDGMCFGPDGYLWVAFWAGGCLRAFDSEAKLVRQIPLPINYPTKPAFDDVGNCYVTSASIADDCSDLDGFLLHVRL